MRNDDSTDDNKAARLMRRAILHELLRPYGPDAADPADNLQAVARSLVVKAAGGELSAIKEVLDRIDGKTPAAPASETDETSTQTPKHVSIRWKSLS
jgi:hypothetical protein